MKITKKAAKIFDIKKPLLNATEKAAKDGVISKVKVKSTIPDKPPTFEILLSDQCDLISDKSSDVYRCATT